MSATTHCRRSRNLERVRDAVSSRASVLPRAGEDMYTPIRARMSIEPPTMQPNFERIRRTIRYMCAIGGAGSCLVRGVGGPKVLLTRTQRR